MPGLSPPVVLKFVQVICLLSLVGSLIYGVLTILGHFGGDSVGASRRLLEALVLFVLPFAVMFSISVNSPASRYLFIFYGLGVNFLVFGNTTNWWGALPTMFNLLLVVGCLGVAFWMFFSRRGRTYYLVISHQKLPKELEPVLDSLMVPSSLERLAQRAWNLVEPFSPIIIVVLAILFMVAGIANMNLPL